MLFYSLLSVLPVNSDFSPSAESDQEAALPPIDTSLDDSEVGVLLLGNKNLKTEINKAVHPAYLLNCGAVSG